MNFHQTFLSQANPQGMNFQKKNHLGTQSTILESKDSILNERAAQKTNINPQQPSTSITKDSKY
jgi:hypothetical protein